MTFIRVLEGRGVPTIIDEERNIQFKSLGGMPEYSFHHFHELGNPDNDLGGHIAYRKDYYNFTDEEKQRCVDGKIRTLVIDITTRGDGKTSPVKGFNKKESLEIIQEAILTMEFEKHPEWLMMSELKFKLDAPFDHWEEGE